MTSTNKINSHRSFNTLPINSFFFGCDSSLYVSDSVCNYMLMAGILNVTDRSNEGKGLVAKDGDTLDNIDSVIGESENLENDLNSAYGRANDDAGNDTEVYIRKRRIEEVIYNFNVCLD